MEKSVTTDWSLSCRLCKKSFLSSESKVTSDGFIICPKCQQWSGMEFKRHRVKATRCEVFTENQDRLIGEVYAWVTVNPKTTLEGLCGVMIEGVAHRAIADTIEGAMKFVPFLERIKNLSGKSFKLVRFEKSKTFAEI